MWFSDEGNRRVGFTMQDEKNRTTPPQATGGKHRRRRKKGNAGRPQTTAPETGVKAETMEETAAPQDVSAVAEPVAKETSAEVQKPVLAAETASEAQTPDEVVETAELPSEPSTETEQMSGEAETEEKPAEEPTATEEPALQSEEDAQESVAEEEPQPEDAPEREQAAQQEEPEGAAEPTVTREEIPAPEEESVQQTVDETDVTENASSEDELPPEAPQEQPEEDGTPEPETGATEEDSSDEQDEEKTPSPEEEKRLLDMTRTVQLSVEQIMSQVSDETQTDGTEDGESDDESVHDGPVTIQDHVRNGLSGMAKWLLLVLFFVLVIAGFGVAWLYRSATPDMLPQITVTFAGQTVEPTAYKWKVPVIGNVFKRTYADTLSSTPTALEETVDQASPDFVVSPSGYRTELTVTDSADNVVFEGDTDSFAAFQFTANGTYTAKLVVHSDASSVPGDTTVTGSATWLFDFTVGVRPSIQMSSTTATQGSVVAIRVGDTLDGQPPQIKTELENAGFFKATTGWVCYLPIPWNQKADTQTIEVTAGGYTETLELKIRAAEWEYKDYSSESQRVTPYIGENDIPAELQKLLASQEETIAWSDGGFVQPFLNTIDVKLAFGTTEYVGRSYSERGTNNGAGGRTVTNLVLNTTSGELLIAPASGTVLLAKDLGGDFGYTLVIDHGAGVKSIFYNLQKVDVTAGESLKQGQVIASCGRTTVAEIRIGTVPVDPLQIWRGQCDALKYY